MTAKQRVENGPYVKIHDLEYNVLCKPIKPPVPRGRYASKGVLRQSGREAGNHLKNEHSLVFARKRGFSFKIKVCDKFDHRYIADIPRI